MSQNRNFMVDLSILYRNTQKYYDHVLSSFEIGWGQIFFLFFVYEQDGITMQEITKMSEVDKATTTKSMQKLAETGYIVMKTDEKDKRVKRLYTTEKTTDLMNAMYEYRNQYRTLVFDGIDGEAFENMIEKACNNSKLAFQSDTTFSQIWIGEIERVSLSDYQPKVASTIYTAGCNFKCINCPHKQLVFIPENYTYKNNDEILEYLKQRKDMLQGVCITGGEPLMQEGIFSYLKKIKEMGYSVKINTNGSYPEKMEDGIQQGLIDEVSLSIKHCKEKYPQATGLQEDRFHIEPIEKTLSCLKNGDIPYTITTNVSKQLFTEEDLLSIGKWIAGCERYELHFDETYTKEEMIQIKELLQPYVKEIMIQEG